MPGTNVELKRGQLGVSSTDQVIEADVATGGVKAPLVSLLAVSSGTPQSGMGLFVWNVPDAGQDFAGQAHPGVHIKVVWNTNIPSDAAVNVVIFQEDLKGAAVANTGYTLQGGDGLVH